jgi:CHASE3 domain sensor protein
LRAVIVERQNDARWREFDALGEIEIRKRLADHIWSEEKDALARQWLEFRESSNSSQDRRQTLAVAKEANDLARSANASALDANAIARRAADSASESAAAARTNNIIATLALIAAAIAIALSIIGLFLKK